MKLSKQLGLLIILAALGLIILSSIALFMIRHDFIEARKHEIESILTLAKQQVNHYVVLEQQGKISYEEAEKEVTSLLSSMRYGTSYIWANGGDGTSKVHPRKDQIGKPQPSYRASLESLRHTDFSYKISNVTMPG